MGGWPAGFCETITNSAQLELGLGLSLATKIKKNGFWGSPLSSSVFAISTIARGT